MKQLLTAVAILFVLSSCQKEVSFDDATDPSTPGGGGGGNTSGLLVKAVAVTGTDSLVTLYTYDTLKRLSTVVVDGISNGMTLYTYKKYEYDAAGRVYRTKQYGVNMGMAADTAYTEIHYPTPTGKEYDYSVQTVSMMGMATIDSAVYRYTNTRLDSITSRMTSSLGLLPPMYTQTRFAYDGSGRVSNLKIYSNAASQGVGPMQLIADQVYTYGPSLEPVWATTNAAQNFWVAGMPNSTNNAVVKLVNTSPTQPLANLTVNTTYTLSGNKPTSSVQTQVSSQGTVTTRYAFYYQ
jgi:hypothetical protein